MSNETQPEVRFTIDGQTFTTTNENQTPTAKSTTLPRMAKSRNSLITLIVHFSKN